MGREINVAGGNHLNLDAVALSNADYRILVAAYARCERRSQAGGSAVALDAVVEIATEAGCRGTLEQAVGILASRRRLHRRTWAGRAADRAEDRFADAVG